MNTNSKEYLDALFEAIKADNADFIVGHLAHADVDVNEIYNFEFTGETLLHYAVKFNAINILKTLLADPRVDRNAFNHIGYTPLHSAAMYWKKECIDILLADK